MKLINSCSTKYNKGGPPNKRTQGFNKQGGGPNILIGVPVIQTYNQTKTTQIHTYEYIHIYIYIHRSTHEYAKVPQMRSPKFTKHTLEKNGWKSVCFVWTMEFHSVTHAVLFSRGQVSMSLHLWFHLHWYGLHRFHMKRQSPVPSFTHIPKQDIVPKWKRAHREFNIVTHLSHSPRAKPGWLASRGVLGRPKT